MRRFTQKMWDLLRNRKTQKARPRPASRRLSLESLEDRAVPTTANASGTITGVAFVDANHTGVFNPSDYLLPGVQVDLSGVTSQQGKAVNVTATTNARGAYTFNFVQPGTYKIGFIDTGLIMGEPAVYPPLKGPAGVTVVGQVTVAGGKTITENVALAGLAPSAISLNDFSSSGGSNILSALPAGSGVADASSRANNAPTVVAGASTTVAGAQGGSSVVNLAANFTDPNITDSMIQINTNAGPIKVELFDKTAPLTVANFFDYILDGSYNNVIFHRLVSDFVIQTGYDDLVTSGSTSTLKQVSTLPDVENEFGASNTAGTLAMAKLGSNPNSASSQWFFNLADNSSNLDSQNGGFTVFGKIVGQTSTSTVSNAAVTKLTSATISDESSYDPTLNTIPLNNYKGTDFPTDATAANFDLIKNIQILSRSESLTYKVLSNSNPDLVTTNMQDNYLTLDYAQNMTGTATLKVEAIDQFGATVTTSFTVTVSNKPVVTGVVVTPDSTTSATTLTAKPSSTDPFTGRTVTYTYQWLHNGDPIPGATSSSLTLTGLPISASDTFSVQVTPSDGTDTGDVFTSTPVMLASVNPITLKMPAVTGVTIAPDSLTAPTKLTATPTSAKDPYGDTITYTYQWLHNGTAISGATSATLTLSSAGTIAAGDSFSVEVTPSDGVTNGKQFTSQVVTINTTSPNTLNLPKVTGVTITPDSTTKTTTLTASVPSADSSDPYSRTLTYTYQWEQDGKAIASTVASATTATLVLSQLTVHKGDTFSVMVTPNDGTISGSAFTSQAVTVATINPDTLKVPVVNSVTISLDSTTDSTQLTAKVSSTDPNGGTTDYTYQWLQNGTAISGTSATTQTLILSSVTTINKGDKFTVEVTPTDRITGATFTSQALIVASVGPVTFELPAVTAVSVTPNKITGATTLSAKATSTDPYGNTVTYTYQWEQNGVAIPGATSSILKLSSVNAKKGDDFAVEVTPSDGIVTGAEFTSGEVAFTSVKPISIGVPVVDGVTVTPDNASSITTLTATPTSHDPSGNDTITYTYQWLLNGKAIAGATSSILNLTTQIPGGVKVGSSLSVKVTPNDGTLTGNVFTSAAVKIATTSPITLTGPVVTSVSFTADSLTATTMLTATPTSVDPLNRTVTYSYQWLQNGNPIAGATTATLDLTKLNVSVGDSFSLRIVPSDGTHSGLTFTSKALTVVTANPITFKLPAVTSVVITPDSATDTTTLTATPASSDPFGNTVTYGYQWLVNGNTIMGATSQMLPLSLVSSIKAGETFSVIVTPNDGMISGDPFTSHTVTVATASPVTLSGPVVTSALISEGATTLTATPTSTDPNGETVTYAYQWMLNGSPISGATSQILDLTTVTASVGDSITVQITPSDATVPGAVFTSSAVTVATASPVTVNLPVVNSVVITPDNPNTTTVLTATPSTTDPYSGNLTYAYQWLQNGVAIPGATSKTLDLSTQVSSVAVGDKFSIEVTPSDGVATGAQFTSNTVTIATTSPFTLTGPSVTSVLIKTDNTANTTTLTATPTNSDPNGETVKDSFQWFQNGTPIGGATGATLTLNTVNVQPSNSFTVQVTPADATITGSALTSSQVTVQTTNPIVFELPKVSSVAITPDSATNATMLTAVPLGTDPYGRSLSYTFQWLQNGMPISGATSATLNLTTLAAVSPNDVFTVMVTPNDGTVVGAAFTSGNVAATSTSPTVIGAPVVDSVTITPNDSTNTNVTTLTAAPTSHDPSGNNNITYTFQWLQNGVAIDGATSATLNLTTQVTGGINVGDKFTVDVTPNDGTLTGDVFTSDPATIATVNPITLA